MCIVLTAAKTLYFLDKGFERMCDIIIIQASIATPSSVVNCSQSGVQLRAPVYPVRMRKATFSNVDVE